MKIFFTLFFSFCFMLFTSMAQEAILIVRLDLQPENAVVLINNQKVEVVDGKVELTAGKHQIHVLKNAYDDIQEEIKVTRKKTYFSFHLTPNINRLYPQDVIIEEIKPAQLKIETFENATVLLNDSLISSNEFVELMPQKAEVLVFSDHTDTIRQNIELISDEKLTLSLFPEVFISKSDIKMDMVLVKSGVFTMGKPGSKSNARLHQVQLDEFYISKYEVNQALWKMIMKENPSKRVGDDLPVENVSWDDVQDFIERLNDITGKIYRLPTEAEWEYAARGGHREGEMQKFSGSDSIDIVAWYWRNSGDTVLQGRWDNELMKENNCRIRKTGRLQANELGIYDMTGNVWEWCSDWYADEYYLESPLSNPKGPESGITKVCRGGSYLSKASYCRNGFRFSYPPQSKYNYLGFRLVLEVQ